MTAGSRASWFAMSEPIIGQLGLRSSGDDRYAGVAKQEVDVGLEVVPSTLLEASLVWIEPVQDLPQGRNLKR